MRSQIWLGDLVSALSALSIQDDETTARVVELLGSRLIASGNAAEFLGAAEAREERLLAGEPAALEGPASLMDAEQPSEDIPELTPVATEPWTGAADWEDVEPLKPVEDRHRNARPPYIPLFAPIGSRPILTGVLATDGPGGPIDLNRLVERIARGIPITDIPRLPRPSLFRGVYVLVDVNLAMEPFANDQRKLLDSLRELVGQSMAEVNWYDSFPARCGPGAAGSWKPFAPPHRGTPVLVLGDLGIGALAEELEAQWLDLARFLARRDSRLVALVPYPEDRWPAALVEVLNMVVWDRSTSITDITFRLRPWSSI